MVSPSDYTVVVRNIPIGINANYEEELKRAFSAHAGKDIVF